MELKVFISENCPSCPAAKELALRYPFSKLYRLEESEGLAEAAFHNVLCTPSFLLVDEEDRILKAWRCHIPKPAEIEHFAA